MLATVVWLLISARGLWVWRHNARQAKLNLAALNANGKDRLAVMFVRSDRLQDDLRAVAFVLYVVVGVLSIAVLQRWITDPTFLRVYGDCVQAILVLAAFIFASNGEITRYVQRHVMTATRPAHAGEETT